MTITSPAGAPPAVALPPFRFLLHEESLVSYLLDLGLTVPGRTTNRTVSPATPAPPVPAAIRPTLGLGTRVYVDDAGAIRFCPAVEPALTRKRDYIVAVCARRELAVEGDQRPIWRLVSLLDGTLSTERILAEFPPEARTAVAELLAELVAVGAVDASGRPIARYVHESTKRGAVVTMADAYAAADIRQLTMDGNYRAYPDAPRIALGTEVPARLRDFHALTRRRRSGKGFGGGAVARADVEALLLTACGVTGSLVDGDRTLHLRAYPAGGALYGIEVYPLALDVDGLDPAVYHYRAVEHALEVVRPTLDRDELLATTLPVQQAYLDGAAAVICLTANFGRFEQKYGQSGYRALAAEAGVLAQNLILAATALGLRARPIGGFFDDLLNPWLGLNTAEEQFMLAVLLGHPPA